MNLIELIQEMYPTMREQAAVLTADVIEVITGIPSGSELDAELVRKIRLGKLLLTTFRIDVGWMGARRYNIAPDQQRLAMDELKEIDPALQLKRIRGYY